MTYVWLAMRRGAMAMTMTLMSIATTSDSHRTDRRSRHNTAHSAAQSNARQTYTMCPGIGGPPRGWDTFLDFLPPVAKEPRGSAGRPEGGTGRRQQGAQQGLGAL